jgi:hypothetical protein
MMTKAKKAWAMSIDDQKKYRVGSCPEGYSRANILEWNIRGMMKNTGSQYANTIKRQCAHEAR